MREKPRNDATFLRGPFWTDWGGSPECSQCLTVCPFRLSQLFRRATVDYELWPEAAADLKKTNAVGGVVSEMAYLHTRLEKAAKVAFVVEVWAVPEDGHLF